MYSRISKCYCLMKTIEIFKFYGIVTKYRIIIVYSNANNNMNMLINVNLLHKNVKGIKEKEIPVSEVN